jgi:exosortase
MIPDVNQTGTSLPRILPGFNLAVLGLGAAGVCALLWPQWLGNPDLAHGLFMPVAFLLLLHESRRRGASFRAPSGIAQAVLVAAPAAASLAAFAAAGLFASVLGWSHSVSLFLLTSSLVLMLGAALVAFSRPGGGVVPFNWSALVAIGLWLLCAPIPSGTYARVTIALQLWVSSTVMAALHLLGIAAVRHGNVIELANALVGIEEACSGIRSLVSCIFAGLFFSATLVRRPRARILIVALSVPLALVMNFLRSLALTLMANSGIRIAEAWHDTTGYAVLGATAAILGCLALLAGRGDGAGRPVPAAGPAAPAGAAPQRILATALALGACLGAFFLSHGLSPGPAEGPAPDLMALLPAGAPGWRTIENPGVEVFAGALHTTSLAQRTYVEDGPGGEVGIILYLAYWPAGRVSVSTVDLHTPDMCWPGAGWVVEPVPRETAALAVGGRTLPEAEYRFLRYEGVYPQHVWFWHLLGGRPISYRNPYSPRQLLATALRYGFRRKTDQLFVRISSNRPWTEIAGEPVVVGLFRGLERMGL